MEKVKVIVTSHTGSTSREAELCLASGILRFSEGDFSHISRESRVSAAPEEVKVEAPKEPEKIATPIEQEKAFTEISASLKKPKRDRKK